MSSKQPKRVVHLNNLAQDIWRVIFEYLSTKEIMGLEKTFLNNQELLSIYQSSLEGLTIKEFITMKSNLRIISWSIKNKLLIEIIELIDITEKELNILNNFRNSLREITFTWIGANNKNISRLGYFPNLKSVHIKRNEALLCFFINTHPHVDGIQLLFDKYRYSDDYLIFYLRQVIIPSILNPIDIESHSLAISLLRNFLSTFFLRIPELFTLDMLKNLYYKDCSKETLENIITILFEFTGYGRNFLKLIVEANLIPIVLNVGSLQIESSFLRYQTEIIFIKCCEVYPELPTQYNYFVRQPRYRIE